MWSFDINGEKYLADNISLSLSLSLSLYIYIYIYIEREREREISRQTRKTYNRKTDGQS